MASDHPLRAARRGGERGPASPRRRVVGLVEGRVVGRRGSCRGSGRGSCHGSGRGSRRGLGRGSRRGSGRGSCQGSRRGSCWSGRSLRLGTSRRRALASQSPWRRCCRAQRPVGRSPSSSCGARSRRRNHHTLVGRVLVWSWGCGVRSWGRWSRGRRSWGRHWGRGSW
ncbi:hypothetical protein T492DRAFT_1111405 [Pavlovales sp. CCMP2436]|nr:hypothetical protein T492DRAFT_1111405 [Pavlovales sp. CCMP2436]